MLFRRPDSLTPNEVAAALRGGELQLIDVREPAELAQVRNDGATHIPLGQLAAGLSELDTNRPVAFVCRSGSRSAMATRAATGAGLHASNVQGGVIAWAEAGLPLTTTASFGGPA